MTSAELLNDESTVMTKGVKRNTVTTTYKK